MPTITHYRVFLETGSLPNNLHKAAAPKPPPAAPLAPRRSPEKAIPVPPAPARTHTLPALYTTPETTSLPDSPSSFPGTWSPYLINHKRRGPGLVKTPSQGDVGSDLPKLPATLPALPTKKAEAVEAQGSELTLAQETSGATVEALDGHDEVMQNGKLALFGQEEQDQPEFEFRHESPDVFVRPVNVGRLVSNGTPRNLESDAFFELQDSLSVASNSEAEDTGGPGWWKPTSGSVGTPGAEFYDAFEEISSDGATRSSRALDDEFREMRLSMLTEIEGRKQAEETAEIWQKEWKKLSHHLSLIALSLPSPTVAEDSDDTSMDPGAELCQQITVSQLVAAAIARGFARVEVESEMESVISAKNFEIARLSDRVQYYEAANREMSQRNQEAIEMSRQQRNKRKMRQKWFWGSVGIAVTLGTAAIAWSYVPAGQPHAQDSNSTNSD
ncbi:uncharacterized protein [Lolium perenne]|uniref:uncharacterized protein n=1 Tax=Lolium perenne TaxID=4522 RepID=UPI0021EA9665|nr:uncharacterized protein LOC127306514 [Lolium perenne]XP_051193123.1 uncharacterized protein LOC127306514 [Lolium perenne]